MRIDRPDRETLRLYVAGRLDAGAGRAVRRWLIVAADEDLLREIEHLAAEEEARRARLAYWAAHPLRARLVRLLHGARRAAAHMLVLAVGARSPALAPLGATPKSSRPGDLVLEVRAGEAVEALVEVGVPTWFGVFAVDQTGRLRMLLAGRERHAAGERVEAGGPQMESGDEPVDLFVVFDERGPLPEPPVDADGSWLGGLLARAAHEPGMSVLHGTIAVAPPEPGGKQT